MEEYWVDQEKFYTSLQSEELYELGRIIGEIEEGIFYLIPKGFEKDYSTFKVPVIIIIKIVDSDSSPNTIVAIDFKSNFISRNIEKCDENRLRGVIHFFEKLLGFQFSCFSQKPIDDYSRFFGILNTFLRLDVKLLMVNENAFSKLHIPEEEIRENFEDMISLVKLIRALRDISIFSKEWTENFEKKVFFKPSIAVSGFDILLNFNQTYYIAKSSVLLTDTDRNSLRLLLLVAFMRLIDTLSKTLKIGKKISTEYEAAFPIEFIKPENVGNFMRILKEISEKFEDFFYADSGFVGYMDRLSKVINVRENKISQIRRYFSLIEPEDDPYKILALVNGTTSKSMKILFEKAYFEDFQTMNFILENFADEIEKFFMEVMEDA